RDHARVCVAVLTEQLHGDIEDGLAAMVTASLARAERAQLTGRVCRGGVLGVRPVRHAASLVLVPPAAVITRVRYRMASLGAPALIVIAYVLMLLSDYFLVQRSPTRRLACLTST